jgi:uncharacterized RDD family membrane protein YckC
MERYFPHFAKPQRCVPSLISKKLMYRYQTFGSRLLAAIIDGIILTIASDFLIKGILGMHYHDSVASTVINDGIFYFYSIFLHYKYGQTIGKKITNVKVVSNADETKLIGLRNSLMRDSIGIALSLIDIVLRQFDIHNSDFGQSLLFISTFGWVLAELVSMLFNKKRRAIHDFLANSVVIDVKVYADLKTNLIVKNN